jgi:hypothetical protein
MAFIFMYWTAFNLLAKECTFFSHISNISYLLGLKFSTTDTLGTVKIVVAFSPLSRVSIRLLKFDIPVKLGCL